MTRAAFSGRLVNAVTVQAARDGELTLDDVRVSSQTLIEQAAVAEGHGNPQLGANLRRAAEMTDLSDAEILRIYEALRPHRSTREELEEIASSLRAQGAKQCAAFVADAAVAYERRSLTR